MEAIRKQICIEVDNRNLDGVTASRLLTAVNDTVIIEKNKPVFRLLKALGWKIPSEEKPEIGKEYLLRWNPETENENYLGKEITNGFAVADNGYCIYGITHYKEINNAIDKIKDACEANAAPMDLRYTLEQTEMVSINSELLLELFSMSEGN